MTCSVRLSPCASPLSGRQAPSPRISPRSQAADEGLDRQKLASFRGSQSKTSDVGLPGETDPQHGMIQFPPRPDLV